MSKMKERTMGMRVLEKDAQNFQGFPPGDNLFPDPGFRIFLLPGIAETVQTH